jgi:hypothetical protein
MVTTQDSTVFTLLCTVELECYTGTHSVHMVYQYDFLTGKNRAAKERNELVTNCCGRNIANLSIVGIDIGDEAFESSLPASDSNKCRECIDPCCCWEC